MKVTVRVCPFSSDNADYKSKPEDGLGIQIYETGVAVNERGYEKNYFEFSDDII